MSARWEHQEPTAVPQAWQCGPDVRDPVEPESTLAATEGCEIARRVHAMPWSSPLESMDNLRTRESKYSLSQQDWAPELGSDRTERRISG